MGNIKEVIEEYISTEKKSLEDLSKKSLKRRLCTHISKYVHPEADSEICILMENQIFKNDGYLYTGNVDTKDTIIDSVGQAASMPVHDFLFLKDDQDKTVLDHIMEETEEIKEIINDKDLENFKRVKNESPTKTSSKLKQVYFPIKDSYHILSLLYNSQILLKAKKRLLEEKIPNKIRMKYGGSQPQNISKINSIASGNLFSIESSPPNFKKIKFPKKDFFSLFNKKFGFLEELEGLCKVLTIPVNNINIDKITYKSLLSILEKIMCKAWSLRFLEEGWSDKTKLPNYQRVFLDKKYERERDLDKNLLKEMSRFIMKVITTNSILEEHWKDDTHLYFIEKFLKKNREKII